MVSISILPRATQHPEARADPPAGGNATPAGTSASSSTSSTLSIPQTAPAGEIVFTQPPQTGQASFYKIAPSNDITFGWNFTYVLATPTSLTVHAVGENGNTYPVGPTNGIISGNSTQVVWDLYAYQTANPAVPLTPQTYTLWMWGDRGSDAPRAPGQISVNSGLQFGLYTPEPYTPLASGWQCQGCSGALSSFVAHPATAGLVASFLIMFLTGWSFLRRI